MPRKQERAHQLEHGNSLLRITRLEGPWVVCCSDFVVNYHKSSLEGLFPKTVFFQLRGTPITNMATNKAAAWISTFLPRRIQKT